MIIVNMHRIHTTCVFKIILANGFSEIYRYSLLFVINYSIYIYINYIIYQFFILFTHILSIINNY